MILSSSSSLTGIPSSTKATPRNSDPRITSGTTKKAINAEIDRELPNSPSIADSNLPPYSHSDYKYPVYPPIATKSVSNPYPTRSFPPYPNHLGYTTREDGVYPEGHPSVSGHYTPSSLKTTTILVYLVVLSIFIGVFVLVVSLVNHGIVSVYSNPAVCAILILTNFPIAITSIFYGCRARYRRASSPSSSSSTSIHPLLKKLPVALALINALALTGSSVVTIVAVGIATTNYGTDYIWSFWDGQVRIGVAFVELGLVIVNASLMWAVFIVSVRERKRWRKAVK